MSHWMIRGRHGATGVTTKYDFDAWLYRVAPPPYLFAPPLHGCSLSASPDGEHAFPSSSTFAQVAAAMEDVKFAFNAYNFVRVCAFYGALHPRHPPSLVGGAASTAPSMHISQRGNRLFHMWCRTGQPLVPAARAVRVGLTPHPVKGVCIDRVNWARLVFSSSEALQQQRAEIECGKSTWPEIACSASAGVGDATITDKTSAPSASATSIQLVVGTENGLSEQLTAECDLCVCIPQFGSIGSLSVINALTVGMHRVHTGLRGKPLWMGAGAGNVARCTTTVWTPELARAFHVPSSSSPDPAEASASATSPADSGLVRAAGPDAFNTEGHTHPHGPAFAGLNDATVLHRLAMLRNAHYPLQLSVLWHNTVSDRNIGATVRNANVYNCEHMIVLGRHKYSRRGTVGCHHYTHVVHADSLAEAEQMGLLDGYELWALVNELPYFCNWNYLAAQQRKHASAADGALVAAVLEQMSPLRAGGCGTGPLSQCSRSTRARVGRLFDDLCGNAAAERGDAAVLVPGGPRVVHLDDEPALVAEMAAARVQRGRRGIALVVPEEGCSVHPALAARCELQLRVVRPEFLHQERQCGLPGSLSSVVALDRLRSLMMRM